MYFLSIIIDTFLAFHSNECAGEGRHGPTIVCNSRLTPPRRECGP
jgi:hypothetical protein